MNYILLRRRQLKISPIGIKFSPEILKQMEDTKYLSQLLRKQTGIPLVPTRQSGSDFNVINLR